ncbi:MAG: bifunctional [glutamate--ammonia ligase]-adenylyl-L-tyrosine phosphorylase/[glutamate--ammonia-ligase] adenylyltransferase, partial [Gammaproteobacteria bacterium]
MTLKDKLAAELLCLPEELSNGLAQVLSRWDEQIGQSERTKAYPEKFLSSVGRVWLASEFVAESCRRNAGMLFDLIDSEDLFHSYPAVGYADRKPEVGATEGDVMAALRRFRRREMVRIAWRDLAGWAKLQETMSELTALAEFCVQYALDFVHAKAVERRGAPILADGCTQGLVVLGMGKLGAYELNYSSDIDLIFAYAEDGVLDDKKQTAYGEFFTRVCQGVIKILDEITVDGFVFRTDVRLRPFGDSGPIVMTFEGMENYYLTQAREWERYAMIKARQVAGDANTGPQLMAMLHAFVYRRYLDYGTFEELRALKYKITQELQRKDRLENIKLGPGGIREIEFIGQAFQLVRGGQEKALQTRGILDVLRKLGDRALLMRDDAEQLINAYHFLRRVENHIQQYQDKQTHDLPTDPKVQAILAFSLGYADWETLKTELDQIRRRVHDVFDQVFSLSKQDKKNLDIEAIWVGQADPEVLIERLRNLGFADAEAALTQLQEFRRSPAVRRLTAKGAGVLDRLMPQLIESVQQVDNTDETLKRILHLFEQVSGR